jgi:hypothetical protein
VIKRLASPYTLLERSINDPEEGTMSSMEPDEGNQSDAPRLDKLEAANADEAPRLDAPRLDAADADEDDSDDSTDS